MNTVVDTDIAAIYARLRRTGEIHLAAHEAGLVSTLRRLARADGLRIAQARQKRDHRVGAQNDRHYVINLCEADGMTIARPDAHLNQGHSADCWCYGTGYRADLGVPCSPANAIRS